MTIDFVAPREIPAGTSISYGRTYTAERDMRWAVLPIGYADGALRGLSGKVSFRIRGSDGAPGGPYSGDMRMVDVSEILRSAWRRSGAVRL